MAGLAQGGRPSGPRVTELAPSSPATRARTGAAFALTGTVTAVFGLVLPGASVNDESVILLAAGGGALVAALLLLAGERLTLAAYHPLVAFGTLAASAAVYGWGIDSAFVPLPYIWIVLFAFYFFSAITAGLHLGLLAASYALVLVELDPPGSAVDGWAATVLTLAITGACIARVRDGLSELVGSLSEAARTDPLTGVLNRRGFEHAFDLELERARRADAPLSLVVGDLDRFKRVNDERGHAEGDEALRTVAERFGAAKRGFDAVARIGGEEFAVLAPSADEHGAYILAERLRAEIEAVFAGSPAPLTISFGIATYPLHGGSLDGLLRAADQALYAAKRLGRNRSVISSAEVPGILAREPAEAEGPHVELASLLTLAEALDVQEAGNAAHCHRVSRFAELIGRELGLPATAVERLRLAGILHDVGRVGLPEAIASKAGPLSEEEWILVRAHPETGARMLETTSFADIRAWVRSHHERLDGQGYPDGLEGDAVPLEARILAVADAYEAMTRERAHRPALSPQEAADELRRGEGAQFDPEVVEALLRAV